MDYINVFNGLIKERASQFVSAGCDKVKSLVSIVALGAIFYLTAQIVFSSPKKKEIVSLDANQSSKTTEAAKREFTGAVTHIENPAYRKRDVNESRESNSALFFLANPESEEQEEPSFQVPQVDPERLKLDIQQHATRFATESSLVSDWMKLFVNNPKEKQTLLIRSKLYQSLTDENLKRTLENSLLGLQASFERSKGAKKLKLVKCDPIVYQSVELLNHLRSGDKNPVAGARRTSFISLLSLIKDKSMKENIINLILSLIPVNQIEMNHFMEFMTFILLAQEEKQKEGKNLFEEYGIRDSHNHTISMKIE